MFLEHLWISEDQRFFQHEGFDWKEMELAMKEAERKGKPVRGASTITNQCARSIFLWQGRSWIRKGLESYYTIWMEVLLPKRRILELYANVIEMGRGIYGVEAASQHYFGVSARGLTREQSAMLAAVLPNPKGWDPTKPSGKLRWRQQRILQRERNANFPEKLLRVERRSICVRRSSKFESSLRRGRPDRHARRVRSPDQGTPRRSEAATASTTAAGEHRVDQNTWL